MTTRKKILLVLIALSSGRAMTLLYIGAAGGDAAGDPPRAWLMPLVGDAVVGLSALVVAYLLWKRPRLWSWVTALMWSAVAVFDALAAWIIETIAPWPDFFMIGLFGRAMFPAAVVMHLVIVGMLVSESIRSELGIVSSTVGSSGPARAS